MRGVVPAGFFSGGVSRGPRTWRRGTAVAAVAVPRAGLCVCVCIPLLDARCSGALSGVCDGQPRRSKSCYVIAFRGLPWGLKRAREPQDRALLTRRFAL